METNLENEAVKIGIVSLDSDWTTQMKHMSLYRKLFLSIVFLGLLNPNDAKADEWFQDSQVDPIYGKTIGVANLLDRNSSQLIMLKCDPNKGQDIIFNAIINDQFNEFSNAKRGAGADTILKIGDKNPRSFSAYLMHPVVMAGQLKYFFQIGIDDEALVDFKNFESGTIILRIKTVAGFNDTIVSAQNTQKVFRTFQSYGCKTPF